MNEYLKLVKDVLDNGTDRSDRTGTGTRSVFGRTIRFSMDNGFPLLTTKKVPFRLPAEEMLWFLKGDCNNKQLTEKNINIWNEWADPVTGDLGPIYGRQWRFWPKFRKMGDTTLYKKDGYIDQVAEAVRQLKENPTSRRIIVEGWNVGELSEMALPPCHKSHQLYVANGKLDLMLYQRSSDIGLGLPFNIAQYALLLHMYSHVAGLQPGELVITLGDVHAYLNHVEQLELQLTRKPKPLPTLSIIRPVTTMNDFRMEDFILEDYNPHSHIKMDVSV
jgi:thymidylate synthase